MLRNWLSSPPFKPKVHHNPEAKRNTQHAP
jgi:hypothetical protein